MTHFNKGSSHRLSAEVKNKIASKYDDQAEEDLHNWIEAVTGMSTGTNFQLGLKDGIILCELRNKIQPGSVKRVNESSLN
ncbi:Calponin-3 [Plecturocebus cupreus]